MRHLIKNLIILAFSIAGAVILAQSGLLEAVLLRSQEAAILGNFLAGFFFTSVATVGPATVALVALAHDGVVTEVALIGALGAVLGDFLLFKFVRDDIAQDFAKLFRRPKARRLAHILKLPFFHWLLPVLGALVIASPLPDEIGLALLGFSKITILQFLPISFAANFVGILAVGFVGKLF